MRIILMFGLAAAALFSSGCDAVGIRGNGHIVTEQRPVGDFTEIHAGGAFRVDWHSGPPSLTITTDENLFSYIEVTSTGNKLDLRTRERTRPSHGGIKIAVSSPSLVGAKLTGAADLIAHSVNTPTFFLQSKGAASITVDGTVDSLLADLTGASDLRARNLHAKTVEIATTGAADAQVFVTDTLRVVITGAGDVSYWGNPKTVERKVTGAGDIRRKE
jgi:Putative auto-transporter adhesin, head GIN domain